MSNVCVSCGAEIPDECGSMICKRCSDEAYSDDLRLDLIHPKEKDVVIASLDFNKTTVEDAKICSSIFHKLEELYDSIVNKEE